MNEQKITANAATYHVRVDGNGPPLLLLHGFTGASVNWEPLVPSLATVHTVIRPDLLGHGQTDAPPDSTRYAMPAAAQDLLHIMGALGHDSFHLLGYSMGGRLALYLAAHRPDAVRTLTLESASPGIAGVDERAERAESDAALADRIERQGVPAFVDFWEALPLFASQASVREVERERLRAQRLANSPHGLANSLRGMGTGVQPSQWDNLANLTMPVLLVTGALDTKFMGIADTMAERLANVRRETVADTGHAVHFEQPAHYRAAVLPFLDAHR